MKMLRLVGRTVRRMVWETAMDNTTGLAAQMAYQLLFTLAPGPSFSLALARVVRDRSSQIASHVCHPERIFAARSEGAGHS